MSGRSEHLNPSSERPCQDRDKNEQDTELLLRQVRDKVSPRLRRFSSQDSIDAIEEQESSDGEMKRLNFKITSVTGLCQSYKQGASRERATQSILTFG